MWIYLQGILFTANAHDVSLANIKRFLSDNLHLLFGAFSNELTPSILLLFKGVITFQSNNNHFKVP